MKLFSAVIFFSKGNIGVHGKWRLCIILDHLNLCCITHDRVKSVPIGDGDEQDGDVSAQSMDCGKSM